MKAASKCLYYISLLVLLGTTSCGRRCTLSGVSLYLQGFDSTQEAVVILSQYNRGGGFSNPKSITEYVTDSAMIKTGTDTTFTKPLYRGVYFIDPGYDYIVTVPATARSYTVTSITVGHEKTGDADNSHLFTCSLSWHVNNVAKSEGSNISGSTTQSIDIYNK